MQPEMHSIENGRKLDQILVAFQGDGTNPGFNDRMKLIEILLFGKEGGQGLIQQHNIMWRMHVWLWCSLSTLVGSAITLIVLKAVGKI